MRDFNSLSQDELKKLALFGYNVIQAKLAQNALQNSEQDAAKTIFQEPVLTPREVGEAKDKERETRESAEKESSDANTE